MSQLLTEAIPSEAELGKGQINAESADLSVLMEGLQVMGWTAEARIHMTHKSDHRNVLQRMSRLSVQTANETGTETHTVDVYDSDTRLSEESKTTFRDKAEQTGRLLAKIICVDM